MCLSDIIVLNLLALIECYGYGIRDSMYYVREKGKGKDGMQEIESNAHVSEMLAIYEDRCVLNAQYLENIQSVHLSLTLRILNQN